jgi:pilus assembly protein Flp/PilA
MQVPFRAIWPRQAPPHGVGASDVRAAQSGQGLVEYALILIMVSVVAIFIILAMGPALNRLFSNVVSSLST